MENKLLEFFNHAVPISKIDSEIQFETFITLARNALSTVTPETLNASLQKQFEFLKNIITNKIYISVPTQYKNTLADPLFQRLKSDLLAISKQNQWPSYTQTSD